MTDDSPDIDRLARRAARFNNPHDAAELHDAKNALDELVALARDAVPNAKAAQTFDRLRKAAEADRDRLAEALRVATQHCTGTWHCGAIFHVHGCLSDKGQCDQPHEDHAVLGETDQ